MVLDIFLVRCLFRKLILLVVSDLINIIKNYGFYLAIKLLWSTCPKSLSGIYVLILQEVTRIKKEHPDDNQCIVNGRVKGRLKVTRAFGAGFLKKVSFFFFLFVQFLCFFLLFTQSTVIYLLWSNYILLISHV